MYSLVDNIAKKLLSKKLFKSLDTICLHISKHTKYEIFNYASANAKWALVETLTRNPSNIDPAYRHSVVISCVKAGRPELALNIFRNIHSGLPKSNAVSSMIMSKIVNHNVTFTMCI